MTTHGYFAPAIEAQHLTKQYGAVRAVSDLSFVVPRGSITGFLGPNGSGKTTTLRMLLGLSAPTSGVGLVSGAPFASLTHPARTVGAVLDSLSMHPKRSALAHLRIYTAAIGVPDSRAHDVLALVGLSDAARRPAGQFSLGMRQRLALATALLGDPEILVLDEPANGLDPEGIAWLRDFLKAYAAGGRTVLISSHILREVEQTVDALVIVSAGSLVYQGSIEQLRATRPSRVLVAVSDPAAMAVSLASNGITDVQILPDGRLGVAGSDVATISAVAESAGLRVFGTTSEHVDLEQVFLSMTSGQFQGAPIQGGPSGAGGWGAGGPGGPGSGAGGWWAGGPGGPGSGAGGLGGPGSGAAGPGVPFGQVPPTGYGTPTNYGPGNGTPTNYGAGYGPSTNYGPGYGPPPGNGPPTTYGPGYGPPPVDNGLDYGPGYGAPPSTLGGQPTAQGGQPTAQGGQPTAQGGPQPWSGEAQWGGNTAQSDLTKGAEAQGGDAQWSGENQRSGDQR